MSKGPRKVDRARTATRRTHLPVSLQFDGDLEVACESKQITLAGLFLCRNQSFVKGSAVGINCQH